MPARRLSSLIPVPITLSTHVVHAKFLSPRLFSLFHLLMCGCSSCSLWWEHFPVWPAPTFLRAHSHAPSLTSPHISRSDKRVPAFAVEILAVVQILCVGEYAVSVPAAHHSACCILARRIHSRDIRRVAYQWTAHGSGNMPVLTARENSQPIGCYSPLLFDNY